MAMRSLARLLAVTVVAGASAQAAPAPLMKHTFEAEVGGWTTFGPGGKVALTREAGQAREGQGALRFDYTIAKGPQALLLLPTPEGALAKAKSFRFWVRGDHATPVMVQLQEKEGGRYAALFSVPENRWQQVELALSDFLLGEDATDPKDANRRLDLDRVESIGFVDLGQFFAQLDDPNLIDLLGVKTGPRVLYVDDFAVSEEPLPDAITVSGGEVTLDRFQRPQVGWIGVGGVRLSQASSRPSSPAGGVDDGRGLQADYRQEAGKIAGMVRRLPSGRLAGMERLTFEVSSSRPAQLIVQLEEQGGGKYSTIVQVPGESKLQSINVLFSELSAAADSNDRNNRFDRDQVNQFLLIDITGFLEMPNAENTLRVHRLRAAPAK